MIHTNGDKDTNYSFSSNYIHILKILGGDISFQWSDMNIHNEKVQPLEKETVSATELS